MTTRSRELTAFALLVASTLAGALWTASGPTATFLAGALFAAIALTGLLWRQRLARSRRVHSSRTR